MNHLLVLVFAIFLSAGAFGCPKSQATSVVKTYLKDGNFEKCEIEGEPKRFLSLLRYPYWHFKVICEGSPYDGSVSVWIGKNGCELDD